MTATVTDEDRRKTDQIIADEAAIVSLSLRYAIAQALADAREEAEAEHIKSNAELSQALFKARAERNRGVARLANQDAELARLRAGQLTMREELEAMRLERDKLRDDVKWGKHNLELEKQARQQWQERCFAPTDATDRKPTL